MLSKAKARAMTAGGKHAASLAAKALLTRGHGATTTLGGLPSLPELSSPADMDTTASASTSASTYTGASTTMAHQVPGRARSTSNATRRSGGGDDDDELDEEVWEMTGLSDEELGGDTPTAGTDEEKLGDGGAECVCLCVRCCFVLNRGDMHVMTHAAMD